MNTIPMRCEHPECDRTHGKDYIRLQRERFPGWENEPIYLCPEHSKDHKLVEPFVVCLPGTNKAFFNTY